MNLDRIYRFDALKYHAWFGKLFLKLKQPDLVLCYAFMSKHQDADVGEYEMLVNRMFLDLPEKPKNAGLIQELLICSNRPKQEEPVKTTLLLLACLAAPISAQAAQAPIGLDCTAATVIHSKEFPESGASAEDLPELPPEADAAAPATTKKKPKKPVKLDPALLEGLLKARNGGK